MLLVAIPTLWRSLYNKVTKYYIWTAQCCRKRWCLTSNLIVSMHIQFNWSCESSTSARCCSLTQDTRITVPSCTSGSSCPLPQNTRIIIPGSSCPLPQNTRIIVPGSSCPLPQNTRITVPSRHLCTLAYIKWQRHCSRGKNKSLQNKIF